MHIYFRGSIAVALAVAVAVTSLNLSPAQAAPKNGQSQAVQSTADTTDFSARRRHYRGNRAALGAFIGIFGAMAALAAADRYRDGYYYYGEPYYYGGYSYGPSYGYAPGRSFRHWGGGGGHHRHHRR